VDRNYYIKAFESITTASVLHLSAAAALAGAGKRFLAVRLAQFRLVGPVAVICRFNSAAKANSIKLATYAGKLPNLSCYISARIRSAR
jgi:hypothetical protein